MAMQWGDDCLVLIAQKLRERFGNEVYRFGGDAFAAILTVDRELNIGEEIDGINRELRQAYDGIELHISVGVYRATEQDSEGTVFIRTDRALYRAKREGKNTWAIYTPDDEQTSYDPHL